MDIILEDAIFLINTHPNIDSYIKEYGRYTKVYNITVKDITDEQRLYYHLCKTIVNKYSKKKININYDMLLNYKQEYLKLRKLINTTGQLHKMRELNIILDLKLKYLQNV